MEPHIVDLKKTIVYNMTQALIPLKAYAKVYERYSSVVNLNIENFAK
jgi:hypothetical protein